MKYKKLLWPILLSVTGVCLIIVYQLQHRETYSKESPVVMQQEMRLNMDTNTYEPVETNNHEDIETIYFSGKIDAIQTLEDGSLSLTVTGEEETLSIQILEDTYIGNYTKSPKKPMSFLEVGMNADINYYCKDTMCIATAINVMQ